MHEETLPTMRALVLHPLTTFAFGAALAAGIVLHIGSGTELKSDTQNDERFLANSEQRQVNDDWSLVSPLLSCGYEGEELSTKEVRDIRDSVVRVLTNAREKKTVTDAGVYFRQLNDGAWFGLDERTQFTPGSLLKVPLALSLMRVAESDPTFGTGMYEYDGGVPDISTAFPPEKKVETGKVYTFAELLELSLVHSDNIATLMLAQLINRATLDAAYIDLGIERPSEGDTYTTSVRTYASFFRILYNGTYLSPKSSQYVLSLLTNSSFVHGLRAGVPNDVMVAHKFGEREAQGELMQLHDCGIVYAEQPYVLCVMLRGTSIETLPAVIADISSTVYQGVITQ